MALSAASVAPLRRRRMGSAAASVGVVVGVAVLLGAVPSAALAERGAELHVAIETLAGAAAFLAAAVWAGRALRTRTLADVLIVVSLSVQAVSNVSFAMVLSLIGAKAGSLAEWGPQSGRLLGAGLLLAAALAPHRKLAGPARALRLGLGAAAAWLAVAFGVVAAGIAQPGLAALLAAATSGFVVAADRRRDPLLAGLACFTALLAVARVDYAVAGAGHADAVSTGDLVRLCAWVLLLAVALREVVANQRRQAGAAVAEERRRLARDLHDGLAQELALIGAESRRPAPSNDVIGAAAERALAESRLAIVALTGTPDEELPVLLERTAETAAAATGARVRLGSAVAERPDRETRKALMRIVREAVANAVHHGAAGTIWLDVEDAGGGGV